MTVSYTDLDLMQKLGRTVVTDQDRKALDDAAELMASADDDIDRVRMRMYFHEGVRNSAEGQHEVDYVMNSLITLTKRLIPA